MSLEQVCQQAAQGKEDEGSMKNGVRLRGIDFAKYSAVQS